MTPKSFMSFDVESVGLHGEGFAVGWVIIRDGVEVESGYAACPDAAASGIGADRAWIGEHVVPMLPDLTHDDPRSVRDIFWAAWLKAKAFGCVLVADCAFPVETRFLSACVDDDPEQRRWAGPYPLHDVATARLAAGLDPIGKTVRLKSEGPAHHPTADARQSARLFTEALGFQA